MAGHPIEVDVPDPALIIRGDSELLSMALGQFLENAAKYSFAGETVEGGCLGESFRSYDFSS